jgi:hypothetical protein
MINQAAVGPAYLHPPEDLLLVPPLADEIIPAPVFEHMGVIVGARLVEDPFLRREPQLPLGRRREENAGDLCRVFERFR